MRVCGWRKQRCWALVGGWLGRHSRGILPMGAFCISASRVSSPLWRTCLPGAFPPMEAHVSGPDLKPLMKRNWVLPSFAFPAPRRVHGRQISRTKQSPNCESTFLHSLRCGVPKGRQVEEPQEYVPKWGGAGEGQTTERLLGRPFSVLVSQSQYREESLLLPGDH